jgi:hypothetical protein
VSSPGEGLCFEEVTGAAHLKFLSVFAAGSCRNFKSKAAQENIDIASVALIPKFAREYAAN